MPFTEFPSETAGSAISLARLVRRCHEAYPTCPALLWDDEWLDFGRLGQMAGNVAGALRELGVDVGDRVIVAIKNRPEALVLDQALFMSGRVRVAVSPRLHPMEVASIVSDCGAKLLICERGLADAFVTEHWMEAGRPAIVTAGGAEGPFATVAELIQRQGASDEVTLGPDGVVGIMYTSGSTGRPKGAIVTDRAWVAMVEGLWAELPPIAPGDVLLHAAPMSHFGGSVGSAYSLRGAAVVTMERYKAIDVMQAIEQHHATSVPLVPTMLKELVLAAREAKYDLSSLRALPYGGSGVSPTALAAAYEVFGEVLYQFYGLSEALVPLTTLSARDHQCVEGGTLPARLAAAGRPSPKVALRIVGSSAHPVEPGEVGEIQVRGDVVMPSYWREANDPPEGFDHGWFRTGDLGTWDASGYVYIVDRCKDVIVTGGFTVHAAEVEHAIETLEGVKEVAVVSAPSDRWGEEVAAVISLAEGATVTETEVVTLCDSRLAGYKRPRRVVFVDRLPMTSTGKIDRRAVRDCFWRERVRQVGE